MQFAEQEICQLTATAWDTVLGLDVKSNVESMSLSKYDHMVAASVQITGAWHGALVLFCPATLARRWASVMFGITSEEASDELVQDALGELANILAGGVKALIPGTCTLTLPTVADGAVFTLRIRGSYVVSEVWFECEGHPFRVSLLAKGESDDGRMAADAAAVQEERVDL